MLHLRNRALVGTQALDPLPNPSPLAGEG
jgi:hypothetical protein